MAELMGMSHVPGLSQFETTHLITSTFDSQKCKLAQEWGLQIKTKEWLYTCYKEWRLS